MRIGAFDLYSTCCLPLRTNWLMVGIVFLLFCFWFFGLYIKKIPCNPLKRIFSAESAALWRRITLRPFILPEKAKE